MSSVNRAGSLAEAPYTVVDDFTTSLVTDCAFWQAASSCIVPMTLISFIAVRPPALPRRGEHAHVHDGVDVALAMTLAMTGLRMSARTNSVRAEVGGRAGRRRRR